MKKVAWSDDIFMISFTSRGDDQVHVITYLGKRLVSESNMGRRKTQGGAVMLWAMFCWETLGPVTLAHTTYLSIVADHMNPFMEMVFPDDGSLF